MASPGRAAASTIAREHHALTFPAPAPAWLCVAPAVGFKVCDIMTTAGGIVLTTALTYTVSGVAKKKQSLTLAAPRPLLLHY
jgi:hypothetical protein